MIAGIKRRQEQFFVGYVEAGAAITTWIRRQSERRPHQALGYIQAVA